MFTFLYYLILEILKLPFGILNRILKLPGSLMLAFVLLLIGAILLIVNHFQTPGGLKAPKSVDKLDQLGLNDVGITGVVITVFSGLILLKVLLELTWYIISTPARAYKSAYPKRRGRVGPRKRSPRKRSPRKRSPH